MTLEKATLPVVLKEDRVFIIKEDISKKELLAKLVNSICKDLSGIDKEEMLNSVLKREEGISTTLDTGLSLPHARFEDITAFESAMAVLPNGITDEYGLPIKVMFLFFSPSGASYFSRHLKLLAALAETFNAPFIEQITSCQDAREVLKKLNL